MFALSIRLIVVIWLLSAATLAQNVASVAASNPVADWQRYTDKGEEFSVEFPVRPSLWETKELEPAKSVIKSYSAYYDGVVLLVESYEQKNGRKTIADLQSQLAAQGVGDVRQATQREITSDKGFKGSEVAYQTSQFSSVLRFYQAHKRLYFVRALGEKDKGETMKKFLDSFNLSAKPQGQEIGVKREAAVVIPAAPNPSPTPTPPADVFKAAEVTRKALIVFKARPGYTDEARRNNTSGFVQIRALLSASGSVTSVSPTSKLPNGLTELAIVAARNIRFLPALKDGRRVSQWVVLQYDFDIY